MPLRQNVEISMLKQNFRGETLDIVKNSVNCLKTKGSTVLEREKRHKRCHLLVLEDYMPFLCFLKPFQCLIESEAICYESGLSGVSRSVEAMAMMIIL